MSSFTLTVRPSEVPAYLRDGIFYLSLDQTNDEEISVPANVLKGDLSITEQADLDHVLTSIRFWGLEAVPYEVIDYLLASQATTDKFDADFPLLSVVTAQRGLVNNQQRLNDSISHGSMYLMDYYLQQGCELTEYDKELPIHKGHIHLIKRIHPVVLAPDIGRTEFNMCRKALQHGQIECVRYFQSIGYLEEPADHYVGLNTAWRPDCFDVPNFETFLFALELGCKLDQRSLVSAATWGHLELMKLVHERGIPMDDEVGIRVVATGDLACVQYFVEQGGLFSTLMVQTMASDGWMEGVAYALQTDYQPDVYLISGAANKDNLTCFQFLHESGCPWDDTTTLWAASRGALKCLRYAYEHGCRMHASALPTARALHFVHVEEYLLTLDFDFSPY